MWILSPPHPRHKKRMLWTHVSWSLFLNWCHPSAPCTTAYIVFTKHKSPIQWAHVRLIIIHLFSGVCSKAKIPFEKIEKGLSLTVHNYNFWLYTTWSACFSAGAKEKEALAPRCPDEASCRGAEQQPHGRPARAADAWWSLFTPVSKSCRPSAHLLDNRGPAQALRAVLR